MAYVTVPKDLKKVKNIILMFIHLRIKVKIFMNYLILLIRKKKSVEKEKK